MRFIRDDTFRPVYGPNLMPPFEVVVVGTDTVGFWDGHREGAD